METLLGVPEDTHVAMKASILDLIAELAQWLNKHSQFLGECVCQLLEQATVLECVVSLSLMWCTLLSPSLSSPLLSPLPLSSPPSLSLFSPSPLLPPSPLHPVCLHRQSPGFHSVWVAQPSHLHTCCLGHTGYL